VDIISNNYLLFVYSLQSEGAGMTVLSTKPTTAWAEVDENGRLILPPDVARQYGLHPGSKVRLDEGHNFVRMHRPVTHLTKVYIEPTVACNLDCITCFRNAWEQPIGRMSDETFERFFAGLKELSPMPGVYFGGIGEPLFHPKTIAWVRRVKQLGVKVELITNGTILNEKIARQLIDVGLDVLWVSLDGASPESYEDVRLGAELPVVLENLKRLFKMRKGGHFPIPEIGIAFVAMKRNIADLPRIIKLGHSFGAKYYSVSNIQPATADMQEDRLYTRTMRNIAYMPSPMLPKLSLPKMDFNEETQAADRSIQQRMQCQLCWQQLGRANDVCNFVESGTMSVAWTGDVSPCWPLMHTHMSYLHGKPRLSKKHVIGNVREYSLEEIWLDPDYVAYRERLHNFVFAPCTFCGGCDLSEENVEDCLGNTTFPVCGGCLWAQGIIQCP
jgi:MoaA/NifB/PqqE/SkfB family radical SAM enzyme